MTSRPRSRRPDDQVGDQGGVLGRALHQRQRVLDPVDVDAQGDHAGVLAEVHPVDHQRHQVQPGQIGGQQLRQRGLGRRDEPPRHRRARGARPRPARCGRRPAPARPGSGGSTSPRASAPSPSGPAPRCRRTARRRPPAAPRSRRLARIRGRVTGTRRPPRVTDPRSWPCRVAVRCGSWRPLGPHAAATSCSMIAAITCSPAPDRQGQQPLPHLGSELVQRHAHRAPARRAGSCRSPGSGSSCARRSPSSWCSWPITRVPTARQGSGGGPPPQVPRDPGQPLSAADALLALMGTNVAAQAGQGTCTRRPRRGHPRRSARPGGEEVLSIGPRPLVMPQATPPASVACSPASPSP